MPDILITDSLFVGPEEEHLLEQAGYSIHRLDKPCADEDELVEAIAGKVGYILGGIETVTERVIEAADELKAIAFTGSGYTEFIPAWELATKRGIAISAATGANADSVAEWALVGGLAQVRNLPAMTSPGGPGFFIGREISSLTLGIVGFGNIGRSLAQKALQLGMSVLATPSRRGDMPGVRTADLSVVLGEADIVSVHVDKERGSRVLDREAVTQLASGAIVVNGAFKDAIDNDALAERVIAGDVRAVVDYPLEVEGAPAGSLLASNAQTAFNTREANSRISVRATSSLINMLESGDDPDLVNPEFRSHR